MCSLPYICFLHPRFLQRRVFPAYLQAARTHSFGLISVNVSRFYSLVLTGTKCRKGDRPTEGSDFNATKSTHIIVLFSPRVAFLHSSFPICIYYMLFYVCIYAIKATLCCKPNKPIGLFHGCWFAYNMLIVVWWGPTQAPHCLQRCGTLHPACWGG